MKAETAKSKASHLFGKMYKYQLDKRNPIAWQLAIKCSNVAVDEIIEQWEYIDTYLANGKGEFNPNLNYWKNVKKELEGMK